MQFMSHAIGWEDCAMLAMAPLGILTIIISAIRVGGPMWMKALIGRARENIAAAEIDLMSSTSRDVCELNNGKGIVRCQGSAPVWEFIILLPGDTSRNDDAVPHTECEFDQKPASSASPITVVYDTREEAPNVSLNLQNSTDRTEIRTFAIFGVGLQLGALAFFAAMTFHPTFSLSFTIDGNPAPAYAFPLAAGGTILLVLGLLLCAHVVESSTDKEIYALANGSSRMRIYWLQQEQTVSDQAFEAIATQPSSDRSNIIMSRRGHAHYRNSRLETKTSIGAVISIFGFVFQFVGFRGMHSAAPIGQLVAVAIMAASRAWLRRNLARGLRQTRLTPGHEVDWLA
ncbi:uncharacterized protein B0I36DRAFT_217063, partial [Microdochium trichocladiopsis]